MEEQNHHQCAGSRNLITPQSVEGVISELKILEMAVLASARHPKAKTVEAKEIIPALRSEGAPSSQH
jgi:hypothetical protein